MKRKLSDICEAIGDGIHGTPQYDENGEYYFINGNNLINGKIVLKDDTKRISSVEAKKYMRLLNKNTILISINGTLGNVAKYNNEKVILGKSACYLTFKNNVNIDYIKYIFMTQSFQRFLINAATGTTIKNVPLKEIRACEIDLPEENLQEKIVKILKCIDNKIELNNQINDNLLVA